MIAFGVWMIESAERLMVWIERLIGVRDDAGALVQDEQKCHICHCRKDGPGRLYCSYPHMSVEDVDGDDHEFYEGARRLG